MFGEWALSFLNVLKTSLAENKDIWESSWLAETSCLLAFLHLSNI